MFLVTTMRLVDPVKSFFSIWWNKLLKLVLLNLLTIACSLTVILLPTSIVAMNSILLSILDQEDNEGFIKKFFRVMKSQFKEVTFPGLISLIMLVTFIYPLWFYMYFFTPVIAILFSSVLISLIVVVWVWSTYFYVFSAKGCKPDVQSIFVAIVRNRYHTLKLILPLILIALLISFFLYSFPFILLIGISSIQLIICISLRTAR